MSSCSSCASPTSAQYYIQQLNQQATQPQQPLDNKPAQQTQSAKGTSSGLLDITV
jgi:hypothetical protein